MNTNKTKEYATLMVNNNGNYFQTHSILTGETGIGFQITPSVSVSDYLHTHSVNKGEDERKISLFSAFDLWSLGSKGAERYWLVGQSTTWVLINLYRQRYYHSIKTACIELANSYNPDSTYKELVDNPIKKVNACNFRLYQSEDDINYSLVS